MGKHYSQKDNLISIMKEIAKKTPRGIMNGDTTVGHITWQMYLMRDYLKLDGTPLANASSDYTDLLEFAQDNNLIIADTTDNSLFKYDSTTDVLTLPNYIDLVLQGGNTVEEKEAGLPNIKGEFSLGATNVGSGVIGYSYGDGAFGYPENEWAGDIIQTTSSSTTKYRGWDFDASRSNSIYSDAVDTVQPPAITLIPQIKYRKATTMYEQIDAVVNYSTTEKVIGTWIDGKPLYQITINGTAPTTAESETSFHDMASYNIDSIVDLTGVLIRSDGVKSNYFQTSGSYILYNPTLKRIACRLENSLSIYLNSDCIITVKYTKTTD